MRLASYSDFKSGREDSNLRPPEPNSECRFPKGRFSEPFRNQSFPAITNFTKFAGWGEGFYCPYCPVPNLREALGLQDAQAAGVADGRDEDLLDRRQPGGLRNA